MGSPLERGLGYVAMGSADAASAFLQARPLGRYLWITQREATPPPELGEVLRVTTLRGEGETVDPKRLGDLRSSALAFLEREAGGLVVLDCLEYLVLHNGADRVARTLADVHDDVTTHGASLVIFVDANTASPRLVAWLAREFDPLPSTASDRPMSEDGLLA